MTCLLRKLGKMAILGLAAWELVGFTPPAAAEINLNPWFYPKSSSNRAGAPATSDDPQQMGDSGQDGTASNSPYARKPTRVAMVPTQNSKQTVYDGSAPTNSPSNASNDQSGAPSYQNSGARSGSTSGNTAQGRARISGQPGNPTAPPSSGVNSNQRVGQNGYGRVYGLQASRMQTGNSQSVMAPGSAMSSGAAQGTPSGSSVAPGTKYMLAPPPGGGRTPVVGPNGVYIDGETIGPGEPRGGTTYDGETMGPGPMMGHNGDGFTNPYCNDCCGGDCGNGGCCNSGGGGCGSWFGGCGSGQCGNSCGDEPCDDCSGRNPYGRPWILAPFDIMFGEMSSSCRGWWWGENLSLFTGVENFRSTVNVDGISNFGFNEGFNWSMPVSRTVGWAIQFGADFTQTGFDSTPSSSLDETRMQTFLTLGVFHRPTCQTGLQYGLAFDWLHDDFFDDFDLTQLRGEISWMVDPQNDYGFWFATGLKDETLRSAVLSPVTFEVVDQFAFFHRRRFCRGGDARFWAGWTNNDEAVLGADFCLPVAQCWGLEGGFNYLLSGNRNQQLADESWNVGVNVVFYIGGNAFCQGPSRPLFGVADNSSFIARVKGPAAN